MSHPSAPKMLLLGLFCVGEIDEVPREGGGLANLSVGPGLSSVPGVLAHSGLGGFGVW